MFSNPLYKNIQPQTLEILDNVYANLKNYSPDLHLLIQYPNTPPLTKFPFLFFNKAANTRTKFREISGRSNIGLSFAAIHDSVINLESPIYTLETEYSFFVGHRLFEPYVPAIKKSKELIIAEVFS